MRVEKQGKSTGVGAYQDAHLWIIENNLAQAVVPDYTKKSKTGNHWTHVWRNVPDSAIIVEFGNSRGGEPFLEMYRLKHEDGITLCIGAAEAQKIEEVYSYASYKS